MTQINIDVKNDELLKHQQEKHQLQIDALTQRVQGFDYITEELNMEIQNLQGREAELVAELAKRDVEVYQMMIDFETKLQEQKK